MKKPICGVSLVIVAAEYIWVRLTSQAFGALHLGIFDQPEIEFC